MIGYDRHSETERVLVSYDKLTTLNWLKIQSGPLGNLRDQPFDGDEMNMHMPQNVLAESELRHLAAIPYQMISPASNAPIIGIYQDSLLGSYRMTRPNITFTPKEAMNLLMMYPNVNTAAIREKGERLTSYDVLSQIMPPVTMVYKTNLFDEGDDYATSNNVLEIRNGKYIRGQLEKGVLGSTTKGILHRVCNDFGNMACSDFNDNLQNIVTEYMKSSSYSVGISDLIADKVTQSKIIQVITTQKSEVQELVDKVHLGIFENNTANSSNAEFENTVNNILNKATEQAGKIGRTSLSPNNRFLIIVNSGSKGAPINISQMISCLGQQNVDGKRIPYGFEGRTLPHYHKFDDSPNARGFIENSYISGLTAPELFFHAMGGRIGLIDTAVKTSQTGYIQRRLIKGLEDLKVEYDMTVRNSKGKIIQFAYGDDSFDSTRIENQTIPLVGMSVEDIYMHYDIIGVNDQASELLGVYTKGAITRIKKQKVETKAKCQEYIKKMLETRDQIVENVFKGKNENTVRLPVAFQNLIVNIQGQLGLSSNSTVDITPLEAFQLIEENYEKMNRLIAPLTPLFKALYYYYLSPKELLVNKRFHRKALTVLLEMVALKHKEAIVHPGEMVGVIAGQSIGEPTTQLTLNSLVYADEIIVRNSKKEISKQKIGEFTENQIKISQKIDYMKDKDTTYAELPEFYEVPCATENGETVWRRIEAVTRHPVINEDGTNTMLKVTTKGNREVTATKAKSFLQLRDGKIQAVEGAGLNVGDYLPASRKPLDYIEQFALNLRDILPPTEYVYGSELAKAKSVIHEYQWYKKHSGKTFTLPHTRSDSIVVLASDKVRPGRQTKSSGSIRDNCVYMKLTNMCKYMIPENIELDYDFGYLVGAYCAEGCMTKHQISIANNDNDYLVPIQRLCTKWNITTKIYTVRDKIQEGWTSQDIRIYNTVLCRILANLCGNLSHNKFVSDKIVFSNKQCILGFLDAYIGGDGTIPQCLVQSTNEKRSTSISIASVSHTLLTDVMVMIKNLGISSKIHKPKKMETNNRGSLNIHQIYNLVVSNQQAQKLASMLNLSIASKQTKLENLLKQTFKYEYSASDLVLPDVIDGTLQMCERNGAMMDLEFDQIISIEEVQNPTPYAYDLTVEETRNFDCYNGLCLRDTFHLAGVSSKSNVTRGVPRIEEILRLTKNPKHPSLTVHLKPIDEQDQDKASAYATMLEHTRLVDVVKSIQICFDPNEQATTIEEDRQLLEQYYEFERLMTDCMDPADIQSSENAQPNRSKWIVRMEMDPETLLDKNITMDDIHFAISNSQYGGEISCVYSDYNSDKLVFRIRMNSTVFSKNKKKGIAETLDQSDEIYLLKNFQDALLNNIVLRGISNIDNVIARKVQNSVVKEQPVGSRAQITKVDDKQMNVAKEDGKYVKKDTWVLDTTGTNLLEALALDYIDPTRTYSNDIREVYEILGIEAARQMIYNEMAEVMEFSGVYINYHHLSLLCDRMTCNQEMVPIFRSGLLNDNVGPIAKATFEVHTEVFLDAARHGDFDHMRGVSANVMCGQFGNYGTGAFQLVLDMKEMETLDTFEVVETDRNKDIERAFALSEDKGDICSKSKIQIRNNVANIHVGGDAGVCDDGYDAGF